MQEAPGGKRAMSKVRVIAVDAAPGKMSTVFDDVDGFRDLSAPDLRELLNRPEHRTGETLVCWDSPLTGPAEPARAGETPGDFTQRCIDKFFSRSAMGFKTPKGISVLPYGQCSHWTISRSILGLPVTGPYDRDHSRLAFHLLPGPREERAGRPAVVEMHPGVAAWLWCRCSRDGPWNYKQNRDVREDMWKIVLDQTAFPWDGRPAPANDDQFDAAIGFILGSLYAAGGADDPGPGAKVVILGNRATGSFLLPNLAPLVGSWSNWTRKGQCGKP